MQKQKRKPSRVSRTSLEGITKVVDVVTKLAALWKLFH
jgi:hypothetical protein